MTRSSCANEAETAERYETDRKTDVTKDTENMKKTTENNDSLRELGAISVLTQPPKTLSSCALSLPETQWNYDHHLQTALSCN